MRWRFHFFLQVRRVLSKSRAAGAIIGGVVGGVVGLTLASLLLLYIRKRHADWRLRKNLSAGIADGGDGGGKEQPSPVSPRRIQRFRREGRRVGS
jgi:hypothetical protein